LTPCAASDRLPVSIVMPAARTHGRQFLGAGGQQPLIDRIRVGSASLFNGTAPVDLVLLTNQQ
jgi:hypothetical protein